MSTSGRYDGDTLQFTRAVPGPPEHVWAYLTDADLLASWLALGPVGPGVGSPARLTFDHDLLTPHIDPTPERFAGADGYILDGTVTAWDLPRHLAFSWPEAEAPDSEVVFRLTPDGDGAHLTLTHLRIGDVAGIRAGFGAGWHAHLDVLDARLRGATPGPFWPSFLAYEAPYAALAAGRPPGV